MTRNTAYGLEQARIHLPQIVAQAHNGVVSVITRHGKPYAAVVSIEDMEKTQTTLARHGQGAVGTGDRRNRGRIAR
jgi:prevent-host-death family protein